MSTVYKIELKNKNVAITGGYGHLGRAIVDSLVEHGADVFVLGRREEAFNRAFSNSKVHFVSCDVSESSSIDRALDKSIIQAGSIDVLINNAFFSSGQSPTNMSDEDWKLGIDGVLGNVFRCIRAVIPHMESRRYGKIINVSSMYGTVAPDFAIYDESPQYLNPPHYGAAKAGVLQLTRYYASFLGKNGITVNSVTPGPFPSDKVMEDKSFIQRLRERTCLNRVGEPKDVAGIFVFLASDAANFITGQNFIVDGGWTSR